MTTWPVFRDLELGMDKPETVHLAEILSDQRIGAVSTRRTDGTDRKAAETAAVGRYTSREIRPFVQYFDADLDIRSNLDIEGALPTSIWIGVFFEGRWSSRLDGRDFTFRADGSPRVFGFSEAVECVDRQRSGNRVRMASLLVCAEFFQRMADEDPDPHWRRLLSLMDGGFTARKVLDRGRVRQPMAGMFKNPYRGAMSDLYFETLALSAIVGLAKSLAPDEPPAQPSTGRLVDFAHGARQILDGDLTVIHSVSSLARTLGTNETTLRRQFKATFGVTIMEYAQARRMEAARLMVHDATCQIAEIAYRVGYTDPANFTNAYKRYFGVPPRLDRFKN